MRYAALVLMLVLKVQPWVDCSWQARRAANAWCFEAQRLLIQAEELVASRLVKRRVGRGFMHLFGYRTDG